eukprot:CAMPEP_0118640674 /NCGR_PEP_ID=MMETSP0785-20121206/4878_1 /TAXON_ID=91992 /ORGANISM="Bolidomonas pacifica, Strain CCMP 1866" /LENGTH=89 /DNA_ID=CAMNT_0006532075 /DNA_START=100 /DNA_END=366 /DNA_ORIENTATION=-
MSSSSYRPLIVNGKYVGAKPTGMTPEEREVNRDKEWERKRAEGPSPDKRGKDLTEVIKYKNGDTEVINRWEKNSYEFGSFGPTPAPPKP